MAKSRNRKKSSSKRAEIAWVFQRGDGKPLIHSCPQQYLVVNTTANYPGAVLDARMEALLIFQRLGKSLYKDFRQMGQALIVRAKRRPHDMELLTPKTRKLLASHLKGQQRKQFLRDTRA